MHWFYSDDSQHIGPVPEEEIASLISSNTLNGQTLVWNETLPSWEKLSETSLISYLEKRYAPPVPISVIPTPPPLPGQTINQYIAPAAFTPPHLTTSAFEVTEWYYVQKGTIQGPFIEGEILRLIQIGILSSITPLWNASFSDWQMAFSTKFSRTTDASFDNKLIWLLALCPFLTPIIVLSTTLTFFPCLPFILGINIVLCHWDFKRLQLNGENIVELGSPWLVPIYLWKRAELLHQGKAFFWVWCVALFL